MDGISYPYHTWLFRHSLSETAAAQHRVDQQRRLVELLGGQWGQIPLERKYEAAEKALYRLSQKSDETNDSYLARADVAWQELKNKDIKLEDLQAYITLRGSGLSGEDKKRVAIDSESSEDGKLTMKRVAAAIRMLGAGFFQEVTSGRKTGKLKTYDAAMMMTESPEIDESPNTLHAETADEIHDDDWVDTLFQEGDEDAILITDFENAAADVLQQEKGFQQRGEGQVPKGSQLHQHAAFAERSFVHVQNDLDGLPLEFVNLPAMDTNIDEPQCQVSMCFASSYVGLTCESAKDQLRKSRLSWNQKKALADHAVTSRQGMKHPSLACPPLSLASAIPLQVRANHTWHCLPHTVA